MMIELIGIERRINGQTEDKQADDRNRSSVLKSVSKGLCHNDNND